MKENNQSVMCDACKKAEATYRQNRYTKLCVPCFFKTQTHQRQWNEENPDEQIIVWLFDSVKQITERRERS